MSKTKMTGKELKERRRKLGMSLTELADALGMSKKSKGRHLRMVENGERGKIPSEMLIKALDLFEENLELKKMLKELGETK